MTTGVCVCVIRAKENDDDDGYASNQWSIWGEGEGGVNVDTTVKYITAFTSKGAKLG